MKRFLTGIQSSGRIHLGNILGAIQPAIEHSKQTVESSFYFIANLHSMTTLRKGEDIRQNTLVVAAAWLACGLNTQKDVFYRQSHVPEVCELAWVLNCFTPYSMLANAHSFKDKSENLAFVNAGLFTYPVLMAADILLYDATHVPVGKDQKQHIEITRDIAQSFNHQMGETFVIPEAVIQESVMTIPGIDGRKMSKSYNNFIDLFVEDKVLQKTVMSIKTDSTPLEAPKNPDTCTVVALYSLVATPEETETLKTLYLNGNFGYGTAKQMLYEKLISVFAKERAFFKELIQDEARLERELQMGEERAREVASTVLNRVRKVMGTTRFHL
ncbi:MAG: tryptophan--tRNA ligase [Bacteroidia bacterium]|nr:tryptophan--tRNA ligase [Bacteroidia bacterium]